MKVSDIIESLSLTPLSLPCPDRQIDGVYIGDLLSWVMGRASEGNAWITIMSNVNVVAVATLADVSCVILAEDVTPEQQIIELAKDKGVNLLKAEANAYSIACSFSELGV